MSKGFTLLDLVYVLAISAILLTLGLPAMSELLEKNLIQSEIHLLEQEFNIARRRAVIDNAPHTVCSLDANLRCMKSWQNKIDIFKDVNGNRAIDPEDRYIKTHTVDSRLKLTARLSARRSYLRYDPDGSTHGTVGSIQLCSPNFNADNQRAIIISSTGRLRRSQDKNNDGLHEAGSKTICQ